MSSINFTVLTENHAQELHILAEHGLSLYIETRNINVLFDSGESGLFYENSRTIGVELFGADAIVLSHGHHDHGNGIPVALHEASRAPLYLHKDALIRKYNKAKAHVPVYIGVSDETRKAIANADNLDRVGWVSDVYKIADTHILFSTGGRKKLPDGWPFTRDREEGSHEHIPDRFTDEISLIIEGDYSACLVVGCSHPGILKIYKKAEKLTNLPINTVIGGSHLNSVSDKEIKAVADFFEKRGTELYLGHCTGIMGFSRLYKILGSQLHPLHAGMQFELNI